MSDQAVADLAGCIGVRDACVAVGASQAGYYRRHHVSPAPERPAPIPHRERPQLRALSAQEQQAILDVLHSDRFVDMSPAEVWATLLDEGVYLGSQSTFYRLLRQAGEVRERRAQATHPAKVKPELVANGPNQVRLAARVGAPGVEWLKRGLQSRKLVCPPRFQPQNRGEETSFVSVISKTPDSVVIAIDPYKASWTAAAGLGAPLTNRLSAGGAP